MDTKTRQELGLPKHRQTHLNKPNKYQRGSDHITDVLGAVTFIIAVAAASVVALVIS